MKALFLVVFACVYAWGAIPPPTTVLSAKSEKDEVSPHGIDIHCQDCKQINSLWYDCTEALEKRYKAPALHQALVFSPNFYCELLRVNTVTNERPMPYLDGIGFEYWGNGSPGKGRFIPYNKLREVGRVTLKDGSTGVVHEFVGFTNCEAGSTYRFRPYADLTFPGKEEFHLEDPVKAHSISNAHPEFDRSPELLKIQ